MSRFNWWDRYEQCWRSEQRPELFDAPRAPEPPGTCRCGRETRWLNAASTDAKCIGCGLISPACTCA